MSISLKNACFNIWKSNFDRKGIKPAFKPIFTRYVGVENLNEYDDILKTFVMKFDENKTSAIYFDREIPFQADFDIINYVGNELKTMDVTHMSTQDITLFADRGVNDIFLQSLEYVVNLALQKENFANNSIRNNFILKLIIWAYTYLKDIQFENDKTPKCMYYGNITRHEIYFLIMLYRMTFDVIYINPVKDGDFEEIDVDHLSKLHKNKQILTIETLHDRARNGQEILYNESLTLQFEQDINDELLAGTGVFRPWQFRDGDTTPVFIKGTLIDLTNNWSEPSRVRDGFKVVDKNVFVPYYFFQIDGEYDDFNKYLSLVSKCINEPNAIFLNDNGVSLFKPFDESNRFQLTFCQLSDGTFDMDEIKKMDFYPLKRYKPEVQNFILENINQMLKDNSLYINPLDKNKKMDLLLKILFMDDKLVRAIDNFDYTDKVPKLVFFIDNDGYLEDDVVYLLGFISRLGFDIVLFNPSGSFSLSNILNPDRVNNVRLDTMKYDRTYASIENKTKPKKGFLNRIFG